MGLSNKYSFVPKVTSRTESYNPNIESVNEASAEALLKGSFNPDYVLESQQIRDNYFNKSQDHDQDA